MKLPRFRRFLWYFFKTLSTLFFPVKLERTEAHIPLPVFLSWQLLQRGCQLFSSQKSLWSPRCGIM